MDWIFFNKDKHFEEIKNWWNFWSGPQVFSPEILSTHGVIMVKNNVNLCAGWVYSSDSTLGYIGFIVMNPKASKLDRVGCIEEMLDVLHKLAKELGIKFLFGSIENKNLVTRMRKKGYFIAGESTNLIFKL